MQGEVLGFDMKELGSCLPLRDNGVRTLVPTIGTVVLIFETYKSYHVVSHQSVDTFREYLSGDLAMRKTLA